MLIVALLVLTSLAVRLRRRFPRLVRRARGGWKRVGTQMAFYITTLGDTRIAFAQHRTEIARLIAAMSLGTGARALIAGTVGIVGVLTLSSGALIAVQGDNQLAGVGVQALTGFISAYVIAPAVAGIALSATIGAGATAQLGAMRISEQIDALEAMGIKSVAYLASTRVSAGVIVVIPLYVAALMTWLAARVGTTAVYGESTGVYDHYFNTFLSPTVLIWSFFTAIMVSITVMLVHTYYGYTASGGPAGVGEAVGRAVRTSLIVLPFVVLAISLSVYGLSGNVNLSG